MANSFLFISNIKSLANNMTFHYQVNKFQFKILLIQ